jgi:hypothetical protein
VAVSYEASVVLIESQRPARSAPPVLERGPGDRGAIVGGMSYPVLSGVLIPAPAQRPLFPQSRYPGARLGDTIAVTGQNFDRVDSLRFRHVSLGITIPNAAVTVVRRDPTNLVVQLPNDSTAAQAWPAGTYAVSARLAPQPDDASGTERFTNEVAFPLLPVIAVTDATGFPLNVDGNNAGTIDLPVRPDVRTGQAVSLFLGDLEFRPDAFDDQADELRFTIATIDPLLKPDGSGDLRDGLYARIRVDGADSLAFDPDHLAGGFQPAFLPHLVRT